MITPRSIYWQFRWAIWDGRDALLVRLLSRHMSRTPVLYVHPDPEGPARAVVYLLGEDGEPVEADPYDHSHVEGQKR